MKIFSKRSTLTGLTLIALTTFSPMAAHCQNIPGVFQPELVETEVAQRPEPSTEFVTRAKTLMGSEDYNQAIESLRTAIRLSPVDTQIWDLYDQAVVSEYISSSRRERLSPIVERDIKPIFAINRIDSYHELDTLYVVGSVQNLSSKPRQKIVISARILDANKKELRRETGSLRLAEKGLFPNESSLFEIPFKSPPENAHSFRVQVFEYE